MEDTYSNMNMKTDIGGDMKVFKSLTSYVISMFSVMLIFAFISCANGTEDPGSNSDSKRNRRKLKSLKLQVFQHQVQFLKRQLPLKRILQKLWWMKLLIIFLLKRR